MSQGTGYERLAHARRPGDQDVLSVPGPIACGQVNDSVPVEVAGLPIVDVLNACRETQLGRLEQARQSPVLPASPLPVNQHAEAFVERQLMYVRLFPLPRIGFAHPGQAHVVQPCYGVFNQHFVGPPS